MDKTKSEVLKDLNQEQIQAVTFGQGPLLIVAGAGTGKTTVITRRIAWLIEQGLAKPDEILALTFTDKASGEMEERIDRLLPLGYVNVWVSTFHSFGEKVLKDYALDIGLSNDFKLLTQAEQWMLVRNNLNKFDLDYYRPMGNPTKFIHALLQHFSRAKDEEIYPEDYLKYAESKKLDSGASEYLKKPKGRTKKKKTEDDTVKNGTAEVEAARLMEVAKAYQVYQQLLHDNGALDFGDLINYTLKLFRQRPHVLENYHKKFKYILVDEFQDTNYAQYELIKLLAAPANNITVVGDDDQSVYKFRGAAVANILEFKKDYPISQEIFLTINYRSYQNILDTAYEFIQLNNPDRLEVKLAKKGQSLSKKLKSGREGLGEIGYLTFESQNDEADGVIKKIVDLKNNNEANWSDFAILVRANAQAQSYLQTLKKYQIPFEYVANKGLYSEPIILDILAYVKLLDNYHESEALYRVLNFDNFRMPADDLSKMLFYANKKTISLYEAMQAYRTIPLSQAAGKIIEDLQGYLATHTALARTKAVAEVYVRVINDLGINEKLAHPAMVREAQYLTTFYHRLQRFEQDTPDHSLNSFLKYLALEIDAGEEGQMPQDTEEGPDTVKIITAHSAKGLEWPYVFIVQLVDRRFPSTERREAIELPAALIKESLPEGDAHLQEERRLFYVAMTRAKNNLYFTRALDYFGKTTKRPSRFLFELGLVGEEEMKKTEPKSKLVAPAIIVENKKHYPLPESFSFSSISAWRKCPLEYKYHYLLKLPSAGSAAMSFGITMHKAFELFLRNWQSRQLAQQASLFNLDGKSPKDKKNIPSYDELVSLFKSSWVDDWYETPEQKLQYLNIRGPKQLKNFYAEFENNLPQPKYLEKFFKIGIGDYKFVGKIDRIDQTPQGNIIIDYKTGGEAGKNLQKVDKDQLIIYQIAAQEFLNEKISSLKYWYLEPNQYSSDFLADTKDIAELKSEYLEVMKEIIDTIKSDSFMAVDEALRHDCHYRHLE